MSDWTERPGPLGVFKTDSHSGWTSGSSGLFLSADGDADGTKAFPLKGCLLLMEKSGKVVKNNRRSVVKPGDDVAGVWVSDLMLLQGHESFLHRHSSASVSDWSVNRRIALRDGANEETPPPKNHRFLQEDCPLLPFRLPTGTRHVSRLPELSSLLLSSFEGNASETKTYCFKQCVIL